MPNFVKISVLFQNHISLDEVCPFVVWKIESIYFPQIYDKSGSSNDIAVVKVKTKDGKSISDVVPRIKVVQATDSKFGSQIKIIGYPGEKPRGTMWKDTGDIVSETDSTFYYGIDTTDGDSGAAILNANNEIIGIHFGAGGHNFGPRMTAERYKFVQDHLK